MVSILAITVIVAVTTVKTSWRYFRYIPKQTPKP